jgi:hypothetical protein
MNKICGFFTGLLLIISQVSFSQQIVLKLRIYYPFDPQIHEITVKNNKKVITKIISDKNGLFYLSRDILKDNESYDLFLTSIGISQTFLTIVNSGSPDSIEINLPRIYNYKSGKAICPICGKTKHVYEIKHSISPILVQKVIKGDTVYSSIYKGYYYMGDVYTKMDPKWYCETDDIFF